MNRLEKFRQYGTMDEQDSLVDCYLSGAMDKSLFIYFLNDKMEKLKRSILIYSGIKFFENGQVYSWYELKKSRNKMFAFAGDVQRIVDIYNDLLKDTLGPAQFNLDATIQLIEYDSTPQVEEIVTTNK